MGLGISWACIKRKTSYSPWRMASSGERHHDNGQGEDVPNGGSPIMEYGRATCDSSPSKAQSRKVVHLKRSISLSSSSSECARQRYDLDRVSILPVSCC